MAGGDAHQNAGDILAVLRHLLRCQQTLLKVNAEYIRSAAMEDAYRTEQDYTARLRGFDDAAEARQAYLEKRPPDYKWK